MFNFEMAVSRVLWKKREMFINVSLNKKNWRSYQFYSVKTSKVKNKTLLTSKVHYFTAKITKTY